MLEQIIKYLNIQIKALGFFNQVFELGEIVRREDVAFPAIYDSHGELKPLSDFDSYNGLLYWRKVGEVTQTQILDDRYNPSDPVMEITYELKVVGAIRKSDIGDSGYAEDNLAVTISKMLESNSGALRKTINARRVRVTASRYTTNRYDIVAEEYDNTNTKINLDWAYFSVNLTIEIQIVNSCLLALCDSVPVEILIWDGIQDDGTTQYFIVDNG